MQTYSTPQGKVQYQGFVLVDGVMHKIGGQRLSDAISGRRDEPVLAGKFVRVFSARKEHHGFSFASASMAAFGIDGASRVDIHNHCCHEGLRRVWGQPSIPFVAAADDELGQQYLQALAETPLSEQELNVLALGAVALPTRPRSQQAAAA